MILLNSYRYLLNTILLGILCLLPITNFAQYKWTIYTGDPIFMTLEDSIDRGRIIYHKEAKNSVTSTGNRGLLFDTTFFAFPSLTGSFAWSQVRVNIGKISFYPHIYTMDQGTSYLSVAIFYNLSRVAPVRGVRTRPSFTPTSLLQLEKEKMNFLKLKFVSEGFSTELKLQTANQETELNLSDYDVNYNYWLKANPNKKETVGLRTFFARPLKSFKVRAYSDKGYMDTTLSGTKVQVLGEIFVKSIDLYQRLVDPNYVNKKPAGGAAPPRTKAAAPPQQAAQTPKPPQKRRVTNTQQQTSQKKVVTTNRRPQATKVARPK
ncbi:MAG: hypothetical protein ACRCTQ_05855 [Brevinemataceae bacterium]